MRRVEICANEQGVLFALDKGEMKQIIVDVHDLAHYGMLRINLPDENQTTVNVFNQEEIHHNCMVQIWKNSDTGEVSIAWKPEESNEEPV